MSGVLDGIRVLDFGRYVAGPYCATLLGFLGAEVIRVERPGGGEDRGIAPVTRDGDGAGWLQMGVNKRSLTVALGTPDGSEILRRLIATADVLVVNLPPPALRKLGLDYPTVSAIRPDIVMASLSAFGSTGPWAAKGGFDGVAQAMSGAMLFSGEEGRPMKAAAPYADFGTGLYGALGVLAALLERTRSGRGQLVEASLLGTAMSFFGAFLTEEAVTGIGRTGSGNRVQTSAPSDVFATRDGHILMHTVGNGLFRRCAELVGAPEWLEDPRFASDEERGVNNAPLCERLAGWCAGRTTAEALAELERAGVPAGPVLSAREVLSHPQVLAAGLMQALAHPGLDAPVPVVVPPVGLSATPGSLRSGAPAVGADTDAVLRGLGYGDADIARLRGAGTV